MAPTPMLLRGLGNVDRKERKPLDYNVLSLALHITEVSTLIYRRSGIFHQSGLELRIRPCLPNNMSTSLGTDFLRVYFHPCINGPAINQALVNQQTFQCLYPKCRLRWQMSMKLTVNMGNFERVI